MGEWLLVRVKPRAARPGVSLAPDGGVEVRVQAPPAEGQANRECLETLAAALAVPRSSLRIVRGERSRSKSIAVDGLTAGQARARIASRGGGRPNA